MFIELGNSSIQLFARLVPRYSTSGELGAALVLELADLARFLLTADRRLRIFGRRIFGSEFETGLAERSFEGWFECDL